MLHSEFGRSYKEQLSGIVLIGRQQNAEKTGRRTSHLGRFSCMPLAALAWRSKRNAAQSG